MMSTEDLNYVADMMQKQRKAPISEFEISHDSSTNTWHVEGTGLQRFVQMTNWRYFYHHFLLCLFDCQDKIRRDKKIAIE